MHAIHQLRYDLHNANVLKAEKCLDRAIEQGVEDYETDRALERFAVDYNTEVAFFGRPLDAPAGTEYRYDQRSGLYMPK